MSSSRCLLASGRDGQPDTGAGAWVFVLAVTSLLAILAAAPEVYDQALRPPTGNRAVEIAFLAGVLRVPVAILQLTGELAADGPGWYVSFQGCWASSR